jgi:hypothetical protein
VATRRLRRSHGSHSGSTRDVRGLSHREPLTPQALTGLEFSRTRISTRTTTLSVATRSNHTARLCRCQSTWHGLCLWPQHSVWTPDHFGVRTTIPSPRLPSGTLSRTSTSGHSRPLRTSASALSVSELWFDSEVETEHGDTGYSCTRFYWLRMYGNVWSVRMYGSVECTYVWECGVSMYMFQERDQRAEGA